MYFTYKSKPSFSRSTDILQSKHRNDKNNHCLLLCKNTIRKRTISFIFNIFLFGEGAFQLFETEMDGNFSRIINILAGFKGPLVAVF